jgi:hypothetical protein
MWGSSNGLALLSKPGALCVFFFLSLTLSAAEKAKLAKLMSFKKETVSDIKDGEWRFARRVEKPVLSSDRVWRQRRTRAMR